MTQRAELATLTLVRAGLVGLYAMGGVAAVLTVVAMVGMGVAEDGSAAYGSFRLVALVATGLGALAAALGLVLFVVAGRRPEPSRPEVITIELIPELRPNRTRRR
jgi:hypothetical protein